jgi:ribonuclease HII
MKYFYNENILEMGLDEAGRGPLLGRVYTAGVILNPDEDFFNHSLMKDSKRFTNKTKLMETYDYIKDYAIDFSVAWVDEKEIDKKNIRKATYHAMHKVIDNISTKCDLLLIDGNDFIPYIKPGEGDDFISIPHKCIVKGDDTYTSIAAASILAKVERDIYIEELCKEYPYLIEHYNLLSNKGYGTKLHIEGIKQHGLSEFHRKSFKLR